MASVEALAGGHPDGNGKLWHADFEGDSDIGWTGFVERSKATLMRIELEKCQAFLASNSERLSTLKQLAALYKVATDWVTVAPTLTRLRLTLFEHKLMHAYIHDVDKGALRKLTRETIEAMKTHNLDGSMLPAWMQKRMKAAMKLASL